MSRLTGPPWDEARRLFETHCVHPNNARRCHAFSKTKIRSLKENVGPITEHTDPALVADLQCGRPASDGYDVCNFHGAGTKARGTTPGRPLETGRYSSHLPVALRSRYEAALDDSTLIELRDESAVLVSLIAEQLALYGDDPPNVKEMADAIQSLGEAMRAGDDDVAAQEYHRLVEVFTAGQGKWAALKNVLQAIEQRRRVVGTEVARLTALHQMLTVEQSMALLAAVQDVLKRALDKAENLHCRVCGETVSIQEVRELREWVVQQLRTLSQRGSSPMLPG